VVAGAPAGSKVAAPEASPQRVRVGGNVQATKIVKMVRPAYPPISKAAGVEGAVILEAVITKEGNVQSLRVMNSQIDPDLA
jgi:protein TonB